MSLVTRRTTVPKNQEPETKFVWTHSDVIALAHVRCQRCMGFGLTRGRGGKNNPCSCVLRAIFRACFNRYRACLEKNGHLNGVRLEINTGWSRGNSRATYGMKAEEYSADFYLVSKRHLSEDEFNLFKLHFLLGGDWKCCCRKLGMDRGNFFHAVYRIEERLGKVFRELKPYPLFPLSDYFSIHQTPVGVARDHDSFSRGEHVRRVRIQAIPGISEPREALYRGRTYKVF